MRVVAELDEEAPFLTVQLEAHVLNGVLVDELERALDRFLPLGELASDRLNLAPLLDGLGFPNLLVFDGGRLLLDMDGALVIAGRLSLF